MPQVVALIPAGMALAGASTALIASVSIALVIGSPAYGAGRHIAKSISLEVTQ